MEDQNENSALNNIVNADTPSERNKENGEKKGKYYISTKYSSHFSLLKFIFEKAPNLKKQKTYENCLYFDEEKDAKELLRYIKKCIFDFYESKEGTEGISRPDWVNEVWVESDNWEEYVEKMKERGRIVEYAKQDKQ